VNLLTKNNIIKNVEVPYDSYNYAQFWEKRNYEDQAEKIALKKLFQKIPSSKRNLIIDIGGGFGRLGEIYAPEFKKCFLVDPSEKLLNLAKKKLKNFKNIEFKKGSGEKLPFKENSFDVALIIRVIHHFQNPEKFFKETSRILKPQGFLILEFANKIHFLACLRAWSRGNLKFTKQLESIDQRSPKSIATETIPFLNHHPKFVINLLNKNGFEVISILSVSNFRHHFLKKVIPLPMLLFLESKIQKIAASFYFGPSIFILAKKIKPEDFKIKKE